MKEEKIRQKQTQSDFLASTLAEDLF